MSQKKKKPTLVKGTWQLRRCWTDKQLESIQTCRDTDRLSVGTNKPDQQAGRPRCRKPNWHLGLQGMFGSAAHKTFIFRVGLQSEVESLVFLLCSLKTKSLLVHWEDWFDTSITGAIFVFRSFYCHVPVSNRDPVVCLQSPFNIHFWSGQLDRYWSFHQVKEEKHSIQCSYHIN